MATVHSARGGTVLPAPNFHGGERAAIKLQKAMKGIGTDEKVIIEVLSTHSNAQRQEIRKKYKALYGRDLMEDLKSELGGHFEETCIALLLLPEEYLAECLHNATKDLEYVSNIYKNKYGSDLESMLNSELSGSLRSMITSILSGGREATPAGEEKVHTDVHDIVKASAEGDKEIVMSILNVRSFEHLRQVFDAYSKIANKDIEEDVKSMFRGDAQIGYLALVKIIKNETAYFAERLHSILKSATTDDTGLIRIIVTHSETDLADIKEKYKQAYGKDLAEVVAEDTSGDYRKILLKLLASN